MLAIALALAAVVPRVAGGLSALRRRDQLHRVLGFAGGALIGVALFETIPEARNQISDWAVALFVVLGVVAFAALERSVFGHVHTEDKACNPQAGHIGAGGITVHAFLDGLAIGAAFRVGTDVGLIVSAAVLLHAFADGLNTVSVILRHGHTERKARWWLAADATVPVIGAAIGLFTGVPYWVLGGLLAFFAGMFLYLGAGSLLPEAHRSGRDRKIVAAAALCGFALAVGAALLG
ncbi:MAG TPA: ZIP family metal transporter [Solirubrobacteraceae bacterium]